MLRDYNMRRYGLRVDAMSSGANPQVGTSMLTERIEFDACPCILRECAKLAVAAVCRGAMTQSGTELVLVAS